MRWMTLCCALLFASACGYHVAGKADLVPKTIHKIYVPSWQNNTVKYRLTDKLPQDIAREFIARTRYRIVNRIDDADAILTGSVLTYQAFPTILDPATGRASGVQFAVTLSATLTERGTGKVLYTRPSFSFNQRYEISTKPDSYFEESDPALDRLSREVARSLVSAILEGF
jgi:outer membrane lipopolysaccharide assembly protein LptE/RlpB